MVDFIAKCVFPRTVEEGGILGGLAAAILKGAADRLKTTPNGAAVHAQNQGREQASKVVAGFIHGGVVIDFGEPLGSEGL